MVVFLDTSAIFALNDVDELHHTEAVGKWQSAASRGDSFLTHNYVIVESAALAERRIGRAMGRKLLTELRDLDIRWVDEALHDAAAAKYCARGGKVSLVDEVSFLVMKEAGVTHAFAFDEDFQREGFLSYPPG